MDQRKRRLVEASSSSVDIDKLVVVVVDVEEQRIAEQRFAEEVELIVEVTLDGSGEPLENRLGNWRSCRGLAHWTSCGWNRNDRDCDLDLDDLRERVVGWRLRLQVGGDW